MLDYLRYYICLPMLGLGIAGFMLNMPWLGTTSFVMILVNDLIFTKDHGERVINHPFWIRLPMYLHSLIFWPALYAGAFYFLHSNLAAGTLTPLAALGVVVSIVWLNAVPHLPIIHELFHGHSRFDIFLGYIGSLAFFNGGRLTAHNHSHHLHVSTSEDHDTARRGESIFTFPFRAHFGAWKATYEVDQKRLAGKGALTFVLKSETSLSIFINIALAAVSIYFAGPVIGGLFISVLVLSAIFVEMINYLQHYGLIRVKDEDIKPHHVWNHLSPAVRAAGYDITNHCGHHAVNPDGPFYENKPDPLGPQMPNALACLLMAIVLPPVWKNKIAGPRLKNWDLNFASPAEQELAREANKAAGWADWIGESQNVKVSQKEALPV